MARPRPLGRAAARRFALGLLTVTACLLGLGQPGIAGANEPQVRATHRDWSVYAYRENGRDRCYLATAPVTRRGASEGWAQSWLLVSSNPSQGVPYSVSYELDRALDASSAVRARVGKRAFDLAAEGTGAWTTNPDMDLRLIVAMKRGRRIVVSARTDNGSPVLDSFSLMGFSRALDALSRDCR